MAYNRSYSFEESDDGASRPQARQYSNRPGGYQVSNPAAFLPDLSQHRSFSPESSSDEMSPPRGAYGGRQYSQQPETQYERGNYGIPMQETGQQRMSEYRRQRQEEARKPVPSASRNAQHTQQYNQSSLGGTPATIPMPPPHSHARSLSPDNRQRSYQSQQYRPYTDRSPSRHPSPYGAGGYIETPDQQRHDPFNDPFSTPRGSRSNLGTAAAAAAPVGAIDSPYSRGAQDTSYQGYGGYVDSPARPVNDRLQSNNSGYADSGRSNFRSSRVGPDDMGGLDPTGLDDDDDDPFSTLQAKKDKKRGKGGVAAGAGAAGAAGFLGGYNPANGDSSGQYNPVPGGSNGDKGGEKSDWLSKQTGHSKRLKWIVFGLIALVVILAIVGGVIGVLVSNNSGSSSKDASDDDSNGPLTKDSAAIKKLMNNANLHKVFPGIDYTPQDSQYPDCLTNPPSQNVITKDVAVLSQLSPIIRLYGTDCNQTEMVVQAVNTLGLQDDVKIWASIYLNNNATTNKRQTEQWWDVLDRQGPDPFLGVIVGNEVLFREDLTETELIEKITSVKTQMGTKGASGLKVATSDLGSLWTTTLAQAVDTVMANVHPFFGGLPAKQAAGWTYNYWMENDVALTGDSKEHIISEAGWPTGGGNDCTNPNGSARTCDGADDGAVAGIDDLNTFMNEWVCPALKNGTEYFWFEAFDEPWKVMYNEPGKAWEDKWGLMTPDREIKSGVTIPDCGGEEAVLPARRRKRAVSLRV